MTYWDRVSHRLYRPLKIGQLLPEVQFRLQSATAKVYIVSLRSHNDDRPSKFIVMADNMKSAIKMAWSHGGADFQSRFDKSAAQAAQMKEGALRGAVMGDATNSVVF